MPTNAYNILIMITMDMLCQKEHFKNVLIIFMPGELDMKKHLLE